MRLPGKMTGEVLRHVMQKPATIRYPFEPVQMPPQFRGKMMFIAEKCSGCNLCVKECPAAALRVTKVGNKRFEAVFALDQCIYCGQCIDSCRRGAIVATAEFELAALCRDNLRAVFHAPEAPQGSEAQTSEAPAADNGKAVGAKPAPVASAATPPPA